MTTGGQRRINRREGKILRRQRKVQLQDKHADGGFDNTCGPSVCPVKCLVELQGTLFAKQIVNNFSTLSDR